MRGEVVVDEFRDRTKKSKRGGAGGAPRAVIIDGTPEARKLKPQQKSVNLN
jgi:hypothetical protein